MTTRGATTRQRTQRFPALPSAVAIEMRLEKFIPRTPLDVWSIVTDWVVAEYWLGIERLRPLHAGEKPKVGTKLTYRVRGKEHPMTITRLEPEKRLTLESFQGGITVTYAYGFHRVEGGTRVELDAACTADPGFWKLVLPLARFLMERSDRKQLDALSALVEATTGGGQRVSKKHADDASDQGRR